MDIDIPREQMLLLAAKSPEEQRAFLKKCRPADLLLIDAAFEAWSATGQLAPAGAHWRVWLMLAGRGYGKTRAGAEWIHRLALTGGKRIALVGATIDEARTVMIEGSSGLLSIARRKRARVKWEPSLGRLTWRKGSVAQLYSGDNANGLRGPEHHFGWGAAARRFPVVSGGRGAAAPGAARQPGDRTGLYRRDRRDRCLGRP